MNTLILYIQDSNQQSYRAFIAADSTEDSIMMNGDIVTDSESDDVDACSSSIFSDGVEQAIVKR